MFKIVRTYEDPAASQSGFATPGGGEQSNGDPSYLSLASDPIDYVPERPTKGLFSWLFPANPAASQRGFPEPENALEHRPPGSMPNVPPIFGEVEQVYTPYFSRGAAAYVPNTGKLLTNPIGAGVVALQRPQASYGPSGQYINGAIWWTSQVIPTNISLQGLTNPDELAELLSQVEIQAVVRTTG